MTIHNFDVCLSYFTELHHRRSQILSYGGSPQTPHIEKRASHKKKNPPSPVGTRNMHNNNNTLLYPHIEIIQL